MTSRYIENASSGTQYYFNPNDATTSQLFRTHQSYVLSPYVSSNYSAYSRDISSPRSLNQPIRLDDSYQTPQQYHSVAGFNRGVTHPHYQTPQSLPHGQTTVRAINNQDQNYLRRSPQPKQVSPQHHHFQFDTRQQPGHPTGPPVIYQTPGAAQFTHRNVDIWTENPSRNYDHHSQVIELFMIICINQIDMLFIKYRLDEYQFDLYQVTLLKDIKIIYNNTIVN